MRRVLAAALLAVSILAVTSSAEAKAPPSGFQVCGRTACAAIDAFADAEPLLVAITATMLAPMANRIGIPSRSVNTGTMMTPPPNPRIAPPMPATTETRKTAKNTGFSRALGRYGEADSMRARALLRRARRGTPRPPIAEGSMGRPEKKRP